MKLWRRKPARWRAPKVTVFLEPRFDGDHGVRLATGLKLDRVEYLIPAEQTVDISVGDGAPLIVTLGFFASDIEFKDRAR